MDEPVMPRAKNGNSAFIWEGRSAFRQWINVMQVERTPATSSQVCEGALCVSVEDALAEFPPGLGVV